MQDLIPSNTSIIIGGTLIIMGIYVKDALYNMSGHTLTQPILTQFIFRFIGIYFFVGHISQKERKERSSVLCHIEVSLWQIGFNDLPIFKENKDLFGREVKREKMLLFIRRIKPPPD
jgi:hypothetical protein